MNRKLARTLDSYLTTDPFEYGPADVGTDRPLVDPEASAVAERNERATRQTTVVASIHAAPGEELQRLATALHKILWMREAGRTENESVWAVEAARRIIDIID